MDFTRLNHSNGSWNDFKTNWQKQCREQKEDFSEFASSSFLTLQEECDKTTSDENSGVFGLKDTNNEFHAACFLNCAHIKGFEGKVLRVRHLILSPYFEFTDLGIEKYASVLADSFMSILDISENELLAKHIKIHYRSPYDRNFFAAFGLALKPSRNLDKVESVGMWLHVSKL